MVEADLGDCMIALPPQLFYRSRIPVCRWFAMCNKRNGHFEERRGERRSYLRRCGPADGLTFRSSLMSY
jgi:hypothetical protein